jgi:hypothetical protein
VSRWKSFPVLFPLSETAPAYAVQTGGRPFESVA